MIDGKDIQPIWWHSFTEDCHSMINSLPLPLICPKSIGAHQSPDASQKGTQLWNVYLSIRLTIYSNLYFSIHIYAYTYSLYLFINHYINPSIHYIYPSIHLSIFSSIHIHIYPYLYLSIYPSIYLWIVLHLSINLCAIHPSI